MTDVKTDPIKASFVEEDNFYDDDMTAKISGSIAIQSWIDEGDPNSQRWIYACPCGCGASGALRVGLNEKPTKAPSWAWNGSKEKPTLTPSVHHIGHWHGFLTDGVWLSC